MGLAMTRGLGAAVLTILVGAAAAAICGGPALRAQEVAPPAWPDEPALTHFRIRDSETLDAATLLNAISDEPRFNGPWAEVRARWRARFAADPAAEAALARWIGRGIQLAYLLSALHEDRLAGAVERLAEPDAALAEIEAVFDEPAYRNVLDDLAARPEDVRTILSFLLSHGFLEEREAGERAALDRVRADLVATLAPLDTPRYINLIEAFTGREIPGGRIDLYVLAYSRPLSFQLSGFAVGWSGAQDDAAWLLTHEILHKLDPSPEVLDRLDRLIREDAFYAAASSRIHGEFHEGREEELVDAAAVYVAETLGLLSPTRALRHLKFMYWSDRLRQGGVPLAAIVYDALRRSGGISPGFDYDRFLLDLFESGPLQAGEVEARYRAVIRPVSGMAGVVLEAQTDGARVARIFDGYPAAAAGLQPGDLVVSIDGTATRGLDLESILDLLAGEPGRTIRLEIRRAGAPHSLSLQLR